jgi:hypothetical protein
MGPEIDFWVAMYGSVVATGVLIYHIVRWIKRRNRS